MIDYVDYKDIDHVLISSFIPEYMNCFYSDQCITLTNLHEIRDMMRLKQIKGKAWFLSNFLNEDRSKKILVIGGWFGFTSFVLHKLGFVNITEIDIDPRSAIISTHANRFNKKFRHHVCDANDFDIENFDIVINTSCEHIRDDNWFKNLSSGCKLYLQSTDLIGHDHTNICENVEQMIMKYPMNLSYTGKLSLDAYNRFMLIGSVN